jgi:hypothetical protein
VGDRLHDGVGCSRCVLGHVQIQGGMYVREMSLTSTSSKDHLLKSLMEPSPTMSAGRMAVCCVGSSPATQSVSIFTDTKGPREGKYRRTWLEW